jgi:hypothetical protein
MGIDYWNAISTVSRDFYLIEMFSKLRLCFEAVLL